mgnify:CR=1 FL=1
MWHKPYAMKNLRCLALIVIAISLSLQISFAQDNPDLTLDRIYSSEFRQEWFTPVQWIEDGAAFVRMEKSEMMPEYYELVRYESRNQDKSIFIPASEMIPEGATNPIRIESFSLSNDGSLALLFTNSSRVWRSNTKGDYYLYDFENHKIKRVGATFPSSSLMFAKISSDNSFVAYVHNFNIYTENLNTGEITQLTTDGNGDIINGTFDWVYEEEFGCRDGFRISPQGNKIAFWQLDASKIGTFYMINNTDSIYSKIIPVQYPKVGQDPSSAKVGWVDLTTNALSWIEVPGDKVQNYIPSIQWVDEDNLLIQQINRKQNHLKIYLVTPSTGSIEMVYEEKEDTWVDLSYPDVTGNQWGENALPFTEDGESFLRMTENDGWRHIYKVNIKTKEKTLLTPGDYDVASMYSASNKYIYFNASPYNSTQRYLYRADLKGKGDTVRITPPEYQGINTYNFSPNADFAFHTHTSALQARTVRLINVKKHEILKEMLDNKAFTGKLKTLALPKVKFFNVEVEEGVFVDGRMVLPPDFDEKKKYPVLFHVYGEPWGAVATDAFIGMWNIMMAQKGFLVIDMDNRGTPCLKGSDWRKSIYRKIGVINADDQAKAAEKVLQWDYTDPERVAVWGWSGGGSMTLNLMFRFPEIYQTGIAIAAVSNQLIYDNIYQERYMGLPSENPEDFEVGSPITYAKNLKGNLLLIHGTADDNVHYQSAEMLINELVKHNRQFDLMIYPNRSHGIYEGYNTRKHLYTLITDYLLEHTK